MYIEICIQIDIVYAHNDDVKKNIKVDYTIMIIIDILMYIDEREYSIECNLEAMLKLIYSYDFCNIRIVILIDEIRMGFIKMSTKKLG